jgi:uroporphyrinogen decarboxylase
MMNSQDRILGALRREPIDRVPIVLRLGLEYLEHELIGPIEGNPSTCLQTDLLESVIEVQEELGLDPVLYPHWWHGMFISSWPSAIFSWPEEACQDWQITKEIDPSRSQVTFTMTTPKGSLTTSCRYERYQKWALDCMIKEPEDIDLLRYRPEPEALDTRLLKGMVDTLGDRGIVNLIYPGAWDEALHLRGMNELLFDVYDRPEWVKELLAILTDYSVRILAHICRTTGLHCVMHNDSFIGIASAETYDEFTAENDRRMIDAVKASGAIADFHNCGKTDHLLERMAAAEPDVIETLTPPAASGGGDIELADAKRRVGDKVSLMGGFNERVLATGDAEDVRQEVRRCLDAAMDGGGYVLYGAGQIMEASRENFAALVDMVAEYGTYTS